MVTKKMTIGLPSGLEARPVAMLVQVASQFGSSIHVEYDNKRVNAKSIMGMMTLALHEGDEVSIVAEGEDEEAAITKIEEYLSQGK